MNILLSKLKNCKVIKHFIHAPDYGYLQASRAEYKVRKLRFLKEMGMGKRICRINYGR